MTPRKWNAWERPHPGIARHHSQHVPSSPRTLPGIFLTASLAAGDSALSAGPAPNSLQQQFRRLPDHVVS